MLEVTDEAIVRDLLAGIALHAILTHDVGKWTPAAIAESAYSHADAMIKARDDGQ